MLNFFFSLQTKLKQGSYSEFAHQLHSWFSEELSGNEKLNDICAAKVHELETILKVIFSPFRPISRMTQTTLSVKSKKGNKLDSFGQNKLIPNMQQKDVVTYREVQGHESNEFLSIFKSFGGIKYGKPISLTR